MNFTGDRYRITAKGRAILRGPALWGLSIHLRDLLALCDPEATLAHARQFMPPGSLREGLYALRELGLIEGPPLPVPQTPPWEFSSASRLRARGPAPAP